MGKKMANEELHDLHTSSNIIQVIKSIRMRWPGQVGGRGMVHIGFS